ncbi:MAG: RNA polymerase sigma factor RpoH [Alphaproteobacteria bacterium]
MSNNILVPTFGENDISSYISQVWKFPILEAEEEYSLARRYVQDKDLEAARQLVTSHLRLVVKLAMKYKGYGLPMVDMISEGNIGLMKAVQKFEPEKGFRLSTYAMWWIKASMTEYILRSWSMVRMGTLAAQKKLFFSLRRVKEKLNIHDEGELTPQDAQRLSDEIGLPSKEISDFNRRLMARDASLNTPILDENGTEFQDTLQSESLSPEDSYTEEASAQIQKKILADAMENLPERDQEILRRRFLVDEPETLEAIGQDLNISRERVRQLESRAYKNLKKTIIEKAQMMGGVQAIL